MDNSEFNFLPSSPVSQMDSKNERCIQRVKLNISMIPFNSAIVPPRMTRNGVEVINWTEWQFALSQEQKRNALIVSSVNSWIKEGRKCVIVTKFVQHAEALAKELKGNIVRFNYIPTMSNLSASNVLVMTYATLLMCAFDSPRRILLTYPVPIACQHFGKDLHCIWDKSSSLRKKWQQYQLNSEILIE